MGIESVVNIDIFNENRPSNINFMHLDKREKKHKKIERGDKENRDW